MAICCCGVRQYFSWSEWKVRLWWPLCQQEKEWLFNGKNKRPLAEICGVTRNPEPCHTVRFSWSAIVPRVWFLFSCWRMTAQERRSFHWKMEQGAVDWLTALWDAIDGCMDRRRRPRAKLDNIRQTLSFVFLRSWKRTLSGVPTYSAHDHTRALHLRLTRFFVTTNTYWLSCNASLSSEVGAMWPPFCEFENA